MYQKMITLEWNGHYHILSINLPSDYLEIEGGLEEKSLQKVIAVFCFYNKWDDFKYKQD